MNDVLRDLMHDEKHRAMVENRCFDIADALAAVERWQQLIPHQRPPAALVRDLSVPLDCE